jgi:hypothetical protein
MVNIILNHRYCLKVGFNDRKFRSLRSEPSGYFIWVEVVAG